MSTNQHSGRQLPQGEGILSLVQKQRRQLIRGAGVATLGCFRPWTVHRAWAQARNKKPLLVGLSTDDTDQYGLSGQDEQSGILMTIAKVNERGGVLGRHIETVHADTGVTLPRPPPWRPA